MMSIKIPPSACIFKTGNRCQLAGWYRVHGRHVDAKGPKPKIEDGGPWIHLRKGATFPPDGPGQRCGYFRFGCKHRPDGVKPAAA